MQFFNPAEKKFEGKPNFFSSHSLKKIENLFKFIENIFRRNVPMDT